MGILNVIVIYKAYKFCEKIHKKLFAVQKLYEERSLVYGLLH